MKYLGLTVSTIAVALLAIAFVGIAREMGTSTSVRPPPVMSLLPLTEQQLRDQAQLKDAVQSWSNATSNGATTIRQLNSADVSPQKTGVLADRAVGSATLFALSAAKSPASALPSALSSTVSPALGAATKVVRRPDQPVVDRINSNAIALPNVSVVLQGGGEGKAVVDGRLVRVGDKIADGLVLKSIEMDAVTFSSGKEELLVRMPLPRLRVLGAVGLQSQAPR